MPCHKNDLMFFLRDLLALMHSMRVCHPNYAPKNKFIWEIKNILSSKYTVLVTNHYFWIDSGQNECHVIDQC